MKNGGPAFPLLDAYVDANGEHPVYASEGGMSLRDYFAAKAMHALISHGVQVDGFATMNNAAKDAYRMADAMLAEREKEK